MPRVALKLYLLEAILRIVFPLLGTALLVAGVSGVIHFGILPLLDAMQSRQWEAVEAKVVSVQTVPADLIYNRPLPRLEVSFQYEHAGVTLLASRYDLHYGFDHKEALVRKRADLAPGASVTAWVNPKAPGEAMLERSINWPLLALMVPYAAIALVGGLLLLGGMVAWNDAGPFRRRILQSQRED